MNFVVFANDLNEKLEKIKGEYYYDYVKQNCDAYFNLKPEEQHLNDMLDATRGLIYTVNKPKIHSYKIILKM